LAFVVSDDTVIVCINPKGETQFKLQQAYRAHGFSEGLAQFTDVQNYTNGYVDKTGKVVIEPHFDSARPFHNGLAAVLVDDKWGFVNQAGEIVIKPQFDFVRDFSENKAAVRKKGEKLFGFIDKTGKYIIEPQFNFAGNFSEGKATVLTGKEGEQQYGFINENGDMVIKPQFKDAWHFKNGLARILFNDEYGLIDKTGKMIVSTKFKYISVFLGDIFLGQNAEGNWGIVDENCMIINPTFYDIANELYGEYVEGGGTPEEPYYSPYVESSLPWEN